MPPHIFSSGDTPKVEGIGLGKVFGIVLCLWWDCTVSLVGHCRIRSITLI